MSFLKGLIETRFEIDDVIKEKLFKSLVQNEGILPYNDWADVMNRFCKIDNTWCNLLKVQQPLDAMIIEVQRNPGLDKIR